MNKLRKGILVFILAFLLLPLLQHLFAFIKVKPVDGFTNVAPRVSFVLEDWWNGEYQEKAAAYLNDNMGLRPALLRLNNQLSFSLFEKVSPGWIVAGRNNCVYHDVDVLDYYGQTMTNDDTVVKYMAMARAVSDTLARMGKTMIIAYAPSKPFFYPEYLVPDIRYRPEGRSDLLAFRHACDSLGLRQVDFNGWFVELRRNSKELLFPRHSFHWSVYGSFLAGDSLSRYLGQQTRRYMPRPYWSKVVQTTAPRDMDNDAAGVMNLMCHPLTETYTYPEVKYTEDNTRAKPRMMYIGDSFLLSWLNNGLISNTSSDWVVWSNGNYYSSKGRPDGMQYLDIKLYNWAEGLKDVDCVVLLYTPADMHRMGDGFFAGAYHQYFPGK